MVRNVAGAIGSVVGRREGDGGAPERDSCLVCSTDLLTSDLFARNRICPVCNFHYSMTARERIDSLADPGSFRETNRRGNVPGSRSPSPPRCRTNSGSSATSGAPA